MIPTAFRSVFVLVVIVFTLFLCSISLWLWTDVRKDRFTDLANTTSILDKYYELTFYQRELSLKSIGQRILDIAGEDQEVKRLNFARNILKNHEDLLAIGLADSTGQLLTFTGAEVDEEKPNLTASEESRRSFLAAKESDRLVIGEAYFFENIDSWILPIRVAIRNESGKLLAVNTSAIDYNLLLNNLESFGFNEEYRIQAINVTYNTIQLYYPLRPEFHQDILFSDANIYTDFDSIKVENKLIHFSAFDTIEKKNVIGVMSKSHILNHNFVVKVSNEILWIQFWERIRFVLLAYFIVVLAAGIANKYFNKKQHKHEKEILSEQAYSRSIIDNSPTLIIGLDNDGICNFVNPSAERITGYSKADIIGINWWSLLCKEDSQINHINKSIESGKLKGLEVDLTTKSGDQRTVLWNFIVDLESRNDLLGFGNDITELRLSQERLLRHNENLEIIVKGRTSELESTNEKLKIGNEQLERALEDLKQTQGRLIQAEKMASLGILSAGVGHEINNPLNFIKGGIDTLKKYIERNPGNTKGMEPYFNIITQGVSRVTEIVKSLSHFSRQGSSLKEDCNVHEIIENCLVMLGSRLKNRIEIVREYNSSSSIHGNEGKLHQAFLNILTNAEQAIVERGNITIKTESTEKEMIISISDNGSGIKPEDLSKISDPFFTTKSPGEGTGLGLYITTDIIEEHRGKLVVNSIINEGSEFIIKLPL